MYHLYSLFWFFGLHNCWRTESIYEIWPDLLYGGFDSGQLAATTLSLQLFFLYSTHDHSFLLPTSISLWEHPWSLLHSCFQNLDFFSLWLVASTFMIKPWGLKTCVHSSHVGCFRWPEWQMRYLNQWLDSSLHLSTNYS